MTSLESKITNLIQRIALEFKRVRQIIGTPSSLQTTEKNSIVGAVNELAGKAASINDAAASTSTTYSASKIEQVVASAKSDLVGGADNFHDTFKELADEIAGDKSGLVTLTTSVGNRVRFDAAQSLTGPQKAQALANIGAVSAADIGNPETDFVFIFEAALA